MTVATPVVGAAAATGNTGPVLVAEKVGKSFVEGPTPVHAIQSISLAAAAGEFVCVLGPSGSGKSTLLRIIGGLMAADTGAVWLDGTQVTGPRAEIGFVFQKTNLMPWRTVIENVLLPVEVQQGRPDEASRHEARQLLRLVGLDGFAELYPKHLSGGMAQRVVLARTLIQQPRLLLMDEPFGALDALTRERLNVELLRLHALHAATVVMVTHSIMEAVFLADRVIVLSERPGRVVAQVEIDLPRPRDLALTASPAFGELALRVRAAIGSTSIL